MTVLSVAQEVSKVVGLEVPTELFSATNREMVELRGIVQEMADRIVSSYDWQLLSRIHSIAGDGSTISWDLPPDYARMLIKSQVWSTAIETPLSHIEGLDRWLGLDIQSFDFVINAWTIYGGQIHIKPALASTATAKFFYQSNLAIAPSSGSNKTDFSADDDTFRLDERLLQLGTIWRWKAAKGQAYSEEMEDYEEAKERLIAKDKGSRILRVGEVRMPTDARIAYPQAISP